jgi:hypothetical protein
VPRKERKDEEEEINNNNKIWLQSNDYEVSQTGHWHYLPTFQILMISDKSWIFTPHFYAVFWQPFWKWQISWKFWKRRIAPLMVTYHYVKFYVSIIIQLEALNINVRNFKFSIGFYSNTNPIWNPKNMALTPFTTNLKTLGSTRNIYL